MNCILWNSRNEKTDLWEQKYFQNTGGHLFWYVLVRFYKYNKSPQNLVASNILFSLLFHGGWLFIAHLIWGNSEDLCWDHSCGFSHLSLGSRLLAMVTRVTLLLVSQSPAGILVAEFQEKERGLQGLLRPENGFHP